MSYGSLKDQQSFYDPILRLGWWMITSGTTAPFVVIWLLWPFQAPIYQQDRWRCVKVNDACYVEPQQDELGFYGVSMGAHGAEAAISKRTTSLLDAEEL